MLRWLAFVSSPCWHKVAFNHLRPCEHILHSIAKLTSSYLQLPETMRKLKSLTVVVNSLSFYRKNQMLLPSITSFIRSLTSVWPCSHHCSLHLELTLFTCDHAIVQYLNALGCFSQLRHFKSKLSLIACDHATLSLSLHRSLNHRLLLALYDDAIIGFRLFATLTQGWFKLPMTLRTQAFSSVAILTSGHL